MELVLWIFLDLWSSVSDLVFDEVLQRLLNNFMSYYLDNLRRPDGNEGSR